MERIKVISLFSGIGAFEQALNKLKIPHEIVVACDNDKFARKSYLANYKPNNWYDDIHNVDGKKYTGIDLLVGGSPCQSFSVAGKQEGLNDKRGLLIYQYIRLLDEVKPKIFIFENVKNIIKVQKSRVWDCIYNDFEKLGYDLHIQCMNALDYGMPQRRERIFLVGFKKERTSFYFPSKIALKKNLQDLLEYNIKEKYFLREKTLKYIFSRNVNSYKKEIDLKIARPLLATSYKMHRAGIGNYITKNNRIRRLTPRECLRLMDFEESFNIVVSDSQLYKQCGNSIVVNVLCRLLSNVLKNRMEA